MKTQILPNELWPASTGEGHQAFREVQFLLPAEQMHSLIVMV